LDEPGATVMRFCPSGNTDEAIAFLLQYRGSAEVVLTAMDRDDPFVLQSRTFRPAGEQDRLRDRINKHQGVNSVYFTVNPTRGVIWGQQKVFEQHLRGVTTLHVDVDPRDHHELDGERELILGNLRAFTPPPSFIIDSGNGFQGFWLLDQEHPVSDERAAIRLEGYNRQLVRTLDGDPTVCQIDAMMRLPGTVNLPGCHKTGRLRRVPVLAKLIEFHADRRYPLGAFRSRTKARSEMTWNPDWPPGSLGWEQPETDVEPTRLPF
jgi:hypothetical protein